MDPNLIRLIECTLSSKTRAIIENYVEEIHVNEVDKQVVVMVDRQDIFNQICSVHHIGNMISALGKAFGGEYEKVLKLIRYVEKDELIHCYDVDRNVPFGVLYRERVIPLLVS